MADEKDDIRRYRNGEMTGAERNALEKKALNDPFLADAIEGAETVDINEFSGDVSELSQKIRKSKRTIWLTPLRIAAGIFVVVGAGYLTYYFNADKPALVAIVKSTPNGPIDSVEFAGPDSSASLISLAKPDDRIGVVSRGASGATTNKAAKPNGIQSGESSQPAGGAGVEAKPELQVTELASREKEKREFSLNEEPQKKDMQIAEDKTFAQPMETIAGRSKKEVPGATTAPIAVLSYKIITGKVMEAEDSTPLPGVHILVNGTNTSTVTNMKGNYSIAVPETATLTYSFKGLESLEINPGDKTRVDVQLKEDASQHSEVVVIGQPEPSNTRDDRGSPIIKLATPAGGIDNFNNYLEKNMRYPKEARKRNINGKVTVEFNVTTSGNLIGFKVVRGLGYGCSEELIRLVKDGPAWTPSFRDKTPFESAVRVKLKFDPNRIEK